MNSVWDCGKHKFNLDAPIIMGVLNCTPDSFSDGGEHVALEDALAHAHSLIAAGADIIDAGGESTRPGSIPVEPEIELLRVLPVVEALVAEGIVVSVDTRHVQVASACVEAGACIINDVSGFRDPDMHELAASCGAGLVVMHMQGTPADMQESPTYADVVCEVSRELVRAAESLQAAGVAPERICIDPGIGFGKSTEHNQALILASARLASLGYPLMAAVSRKSYIGAMTGIEEPSMRDHASALCAAFMVGQGARVVRAHNPRTTRNALTRSRRAVIGLGSNMGDSARHLDDAIESLRKDPRIWVAAVSEHVTSEPAYFEDQPPFVNAVAVLQTTLEPDDLLFMLHKLEDEHERVRSIANGPRTLDLDIEDYEGVTSDAPELMLPHPLALERDFVVTPLLSVLPGYVLADGTPVTRDAVSVGYLTH